MVWNSGQSKSRLNLKKTKHSGLYLYRNLMEQVTKFFNRICSNMKIKARALNGDKNMEE